MSVRLSARERQQLRDSKSGYCNTGGGGGDGVHCVVVTEARDKFNTPGFNVIHLTCQRNDTSLQINSTDVCSVPM